MLVRRRPLLRAAAIGGGAYMAGKARQRQLTERDEWEAEQDDRISELELGQAGRGPEWRPPPQASEPSHKSVADELKDLSALHGQGALTDEEYAAAKSKLLGL